MSFGDCVFVVMNNRLKKGAQYSSWKRIDWDIINRLQIVKDFRNNLAHSDKKKELDKSNETSRRVETYMISSKLIEFFEIIRLKLQ